MAELSLKERLEEANRLITRRQLTKAKHWCRQTTALYPNDIECRKQLYLVCLLRGDERPATQLKREITRMTNDRFDRGDLKRDEALACIRKGGSEDLKRASILIEEVAVLHEGDPNRLACLLGVRGRWWLRQGLLTQALPFFRCADIGFEGIDSANLQWRFNNKMHWQAAACRAGQLSLASSLAGALVRDLRQHGSVYHFAAIVLHCLPGGWHLVPK